MSSSWGERAVSASGNTLRSLPGCPGSSSYKWTCLESHLFARAPASLSKWGSQDTRDITQSNLITNVKTNPRTKLNWLFTMFNPTCHQPCLFMANFDWDPFLPGISTMMQRTLHFKPPAIFSLNAAISKSPLYAFKSIISTVSWAFTTPSSKSLINPSDASMPRCAARVAATMRSLSRYSLCSAVALTKNKSDDGGAVAPVTRCALMTGWDIKKQTS